MGRPFGGPLLGGGMSRLRGLCSPRASGLSLLTGGTFTRSTEGSGLISAPTDGTVAFLRWWLANERRIENRGDGLGDMLLMEGSRTNLLLRNYEIDNASWLKGGGATVTADQSASPDGTVTADRVQSVSGNAGAYQTPTISDLLTYAITAYQRAFSGTPNMQVAAAQAAVTASIRALAATWGRAELIRVSTGTSVSTLFFDARDWSAVGGIVAGNRDGYLWCPQLELGSFPSSPIRTTTAAVTRGADILSFPVGQYPASFATLGYRVTFAPDFMPADAAAAWLVNGFDTSVFNEGALLSYDVPGSPRIYVKNATFKSGVFTWAARGQRMTVEVRPSAGTITIAGATTGNGVTSVGAWSFAVNDALRIGSRLSDGTGPWFGRLGTTIEAL